MHVCGKGCYDSEKMLAWIFYSEVASRWQMDAGADFLTISYCPFCGLELARGGEVEWPITEPDAEEQGHHYHMPLSKDTSQIPF